MAIISGSNDDSHSCAVIQYAAPSPLSLNARFMLWAVLPRTRFCPHEPPTALVAGLTTTASTKWTAPTARFHQPQPVS